MTEKREYTLVDHEKPYQFDEDGLHVTRGCAWSAPGCHLGCGILMYTDDEGRLVKVEGDPENPFNQGRLCVRCLDLPEVVYYARPRGLHPLKRAREDRGKDKWEPIGWDEALDDLIAEQDPGGQGGVRRRSPWLFYSRAPAATSASTSRRLRLGASDSPNFVFADVRAQSCYSHRASPRCFSTSGSFWVGDYSAAVPRPLRQSATGRRPDLHRDMGQQPHRVEFRRPVRALGGRLPEDAGRGPSSLTRSMIWLAYEGRNTTCRSVPAPTGHLALGIVQLP